jgi:hypothetical protein
MQTDLKPSQRRIARQFETSDATRKIRVPPSKKLTPFVQALATALTAESMPDLKTTCEEFLGCVSTFYEVPTPKLRLLGPRPHRTFEGRLSSELFGDYRMIQQRIRLWTRTPMKRKWASHGTILSTICHEFMHHFDVTSLDFPNSFHTVGFYERSHRLYLAAMGHAYYPLKWFGDFNPDGPRVINWPETNRSKARALARLKRGWP